jgi:lipid-A-disaccharide synthase-like uncharacterized protein
VRGDDARLRHLGKGPPEARLEDLEEEEAEAQGGPLHRLVLPLRDRVREAGDVGLTREELTRLVGGARGVVSGQLAPHLVHQGSIDCAHVPRLATLGENSLLRWEASGNVNGWNSSTRERRQMSAEHFWLTVGFLGQAFFSMRFLVQWIASEKKRESVIPVSFWFFSIGGGLTLLIYAVYRQDPVFILGQTAGLFVYLRNLYLIRRKERGLAEAGA